MTKNVELKLTEIYMNELRIKALENVCYYLDLDITSFVSCDDRIEVEKIFKILKKISEVTKDKTEYGNWGIYEDILEMYLEEYEIILMFFLEKELFYD